MKKYHPPLCNEYQDRIKIGSLPGFAKAAVVNRFLARYRLARAFRGLDLEGYSPNTLAGYNALTGLSLHWSAFEQFKKALKIESADGLLNKYPTDECLSMIKSLDPYFTFFTFVQDHLTGKSQKIELERFILSGEGSPLLLSKTIRHIFFHGPLTPNAKGVDPLIVQQICDCLSDFIINFIDAEFENNVNKLLVFYP